MQDSPEEVTTDNTPKKGVVGAVLSAIKEARANEATPQQIAQLRELLVGTGFHATKKRLTAAQRKKKRLVQRESRKMNRGVGKGYVTRKGQKWTR